MQSKYAPVTPSQHLGKFIEELGEVLHAGGKTLRFGFASRNPETLGAACCAKCAQPPEADIHNAEAVAKLLPGARACRFEDMRETNRRWVIREMNDAREALRELQILLVRYTAEELDAADRENRNPVRAQREPKQLGIDAEHAPVEISFNAESDDEDTDEDEDDDA